MEQSVVDSYRCWIAEGCNGSMAYLENYPDKRFDPRLLVPGVRSIVSVALNYAPSRCMPSDAPQFASYALGKDYHDVVKQKLSQLAERLGLELNDQVRAFCDSAPVLERYWAVRAGLGWIGRNHQLIIPRAGSMFFLGELFLPVEVEYDEPMHSRCGTCNRCVEACPTQALQRNADGETCKFDGRLCLNYQTIEIVVIFRKSLLQSSLLIYMDATVASRLVRGIGSLCPIRPPSCSLPMNCLR